MGSSINIYAVYKPEFARGEGKLITKPEKFSSARQMQMILNRGKRYLDKHRSKIKVFIMYQQPGNQVIFRYPPQKDSYQKIILWLKYKPEFASTPSGILKISKFVGKGDFEGKYTHRELMLARASKEIDEGKIWLARIYEHPGNHTSFSWSVQQGEIEPGYELDTIRAKAVYEDMLREVENLR